MRDDIDFPEPRDPAALEAARAEIIAFREANPTLTRTGLAVAFVEKNGSATSGELSILLDLRADQYPSVELSSAVQNGRLERDGKNWKLGPNKVAYQGRDQQKRDGLESGAELGRVKPELQVPTFAPSAPPNKTPTAAPTAAPTSKPTPAPKPKSGCLFAIWSHQVVEIKKPNEPSLLLTLDEVDELVAFLTKMGNA